MELLTGTYDICMHCLYLLIMNNQPNLTYMQGNFLYLYVFEVACARKCRKF